jgi:hypothetical protein
MVALSSSRRQRKMPAILPQTTAEALAACNVAPSMKTGAEAAASRRNANGLQVLRGHDGEIISVRIGRWRVIAAGAQRRLAEVQKLAGGQIAVRIERFADGGDRPSSEIWQLYDLDGRLEAAMQTSPDTKFALVTDYRSRLACRLVRNQNNELEPVETWSI